MDRQRSHDLVQLAGVEFIMTSFRPCGGKITCRTVDDLCHIAEMFFGVVAIHDLDGIRVLFGGEVPYPRGSVAKHGLPRRTIKAAPRRLPLDTLSEH